MSKDDTELLKLAEKELLGEAKRAAARYSLEGPSGWSPCPLRKTNKTFLLNTLRQTVSSNRLKERSNEHKTKKRRERKLFQGKNSHGFSKDNIVFSSPAKRKSGGAGSIESGKAVQTQKELAQVSAETKNRKKKEYSKS